MLLPTQCLHQFLLLHLSKDLSMLNKTEGFSVYLFLSSLLLSMNAMCDDLEIYLGAKESQHLYKPNVLFIIDSSASMGKSDESNETRMLQVQNALKTALGSATGINVGLMRFSDFGGPVLFPISDIDTPITFELANPLLSVSEPLVASLSSSVLEDIISKVDQLSAGGGAPIVDTLYEASLYFGGREVYYGRKRGDETVSTSLRRSTRVSHRRSYIGDDAFKPAGCVEENLSDIACVQEYIPTGAQYISPVTDLQCQVKNHIVLLSSGQADSNHSVEQIQTLFGASCSGNNGLKCALDLVKNLSDVEQSYIGTRVATHTIGFAADTSASTSLNQLAMEGGGSFYQADNSEKLTAALQTIIRNVKNLNATSISPGIAFSQLNRLSHKDELYFTLFDALAGAQWPGNLKKYKMSGKQVLDKNNANAIDPASGFFSEHSHSYWSELADGNDVRSGGAASRLTLSRAVYFFDKEGLIRLPRNQISEHNTEITYADLGLVTGGEQLFSRDTLLKWARGLDVKDEDADDSAVDVRLQIGDPIHSNPVIVNYSDTESAVFVATNHGFLHSIDTQTGQENFAIMPRELMKNLKDIYRDSSSLSHIYGLDGNIVYRAYNDKKYIYIGMRRGGNNYYVIDVTNKTEPKLVFTVNGGAASFSNMGQSWSRPTITKVNIGGVVKDVMIIGGGYDQEQDTKSNRSPDMVGNSIYMIDANNGVLLWSASNKNADLIAVDMKYSIPAGISVVDRDNDSLADHMYVADMGGQIFRFDIYNGESISSLVEGGLIAQLGGDSLSDNRRFYYGPDVAEISNNLEHYFSLAIGSGYRAGPLDTAVEDVFFMIKDKGIFLRDGLGKFTLPDEVFTNANLYDASAHLLSAGSTEEIEIQSKLLLSKQGWMIRFQQPGEKVLSSPLILDKQVFFTTFLPSKKGVSACRLSAGSNRAYLVNLTNGNAVLDLNNNGEKDAEDRYALMTQSGIAPAAQILFENVTKPLLCVGAECASAVIETDVDGETLPCGSDFECLARNIYGSFNRVHKSIWKTEVELQ